MRNSVIFLSAVLAIGSPLPAAVVFGPVINPATGGTYFLLSENSWTASQAEAISLGGNLATIDNLAENNWVGDTFGQLPGVFTSTVYDLWIGYNDSSVEGDFRWVSGENSGFTHFSTNSNTNSDTFDFLTIVPHPFGATERGLIIENQWNLILDNPGSRLGVVEINAIPEPAGVMAILGALAMSLLRPARRRMR